MTSTSRYQCPWNKTDTRKAQLLPDDSRNRFKENETPDGFTRP